MCGITRAEYRKEARKRRRWRYWYSGFSPSFIPSAAQFLCVLFAVCLRTSSFSFECRSKSFSIPIFFPFSLALQKAIRRFPPPSTCFQKKEREEWGRKMFQFARVFDSSCVTRARRQFSKNSLLFLPRSIEIGREAANGKRWKIRPSHVTYFPRSESTSLRTAQIKVLSWFQRKECTDDAKQLFYLSGNNPLFAAAL